MQSESLHCYPLWIHSLCSETVGLSGLEGTFQCSHEQKLSIMNSQLQVKHASEIQLTRTHVEEMAFLSHVKGDHRKTVFGMWLFSKLGPNSLEKKREEQQSFC